MLAGGLDSLDWLKDRIKRPEAVVDLCGIPELKGIRETGEGLEIGAMTTLTEVVRHPVVRSGIRSCSKRPKRRRRRRFATRAPSAATCRRTRAAGTTAPAGRATAPAATSATPTRPTSINREHAILDADRCVAVNPSDTAPALIALDAQMVIRTADGEERVVAAEDYFVGPGIDITTHDDAAAR